MVELKTFRFINNLTQQELGDYLGVNKSFISKVEKGAENFPMKHLSKLLDNDMGWDVSSLATTSTTVNAPVNNSAVGNNAQNIQLCPKNEDVGKELIELRKLVEEKEKRIAELEEKERTLTAWINKLLKIGE